MGEKWGNLLKVDSDFQTNNGKRFTLIGHNEISGKASEMRSIPYSVSQFCNGNVDSSLGRVPTVDDLGVMIKKIYDNSLWIEQEINKILSQ